jgi:hypothetical protein
MGELTGPRQARGYRVGQETTEAMGAAGMGVGDEEGVGVEWRCYLFAIVTVRTTQPILLLQQEP